MKDNMFLDRLRLASGLVDFHEEFLNNLTKSQYIYIEKAFKNPDKLAVIDYYMPSELLWSMDMIPVMSEYLVSFLSSMKLTDQLLLGANTKLNDSGTCSFHKPILTAFENKLFPRPKLFATNTLCGEASKCFALTADTIGTHNYCINLPYHRNTEAIMYVRNQYIEFTKQLEILTNKKFDIDKLREAIFKSNKMREYLVKGNNLRKQGKSLIYGADMLMFIGLFSFHGTDNAVEIAKGYNEILQSRLNQQTTPVSKEKNRILWLQLKPCYSNTLLNYMEKDLGMVIAFEEINDVFWQEINEEDPFLGLAVKTMEWVYLGDVNRRFNSLKKMIEEYRIDGVINFANINCKLINPKHIFMKQKIDSLGIPQLELSGDCIDHNNYSEEQLLTRIEAFYELLNNKKGD